MNLWDWYIGLFNNPDDKVKVAAWAATLASATFILTFLLRPLWKYIKERRKSKKVSLENTTNNDMSDSQREHDRKIFSESNAIFDENVLNNMNDHLLGDHSIYDEEFTKLNLYKIHIEKTSNGFLNTEIETAKQELLQSIITLSSFIGVKFVIYPRDQSMEGNYRLCLAPYLNFERGGEWSAANDKKYGNLGSQLTTHCHLVEEKFTNYRKLVKKHLHI